MAKVAVSGKSKVLSYVNVVVLLVAIVMMFTPYWSYEVTAKDKTVSEVSTSVNAYVWRPDECKDFEKWVKEELGAKPDINAEFGMPVLMLAAAAIGIVLCVLKPAAPLGGLLSIIYGVAAIAGFTGSALLQMGPWAIHVALGAVAIVAGLVKIVLGFIEKAKA